MGRIAEEKIQEIRDRADIVEVVSSYLPLKRAGGGNHLGLCPFHAEKTPSFNVNAARQIFHCFGCQVGGNVFSFVMRMEGLSFPEAVRRLGERVGIVVEDEEPTPAESREREEIDRLARVGEVACDFYHQILLEAPEGAPGRRYLRERGYDGEAARRFRLGYAPEGRSLLAAHLASKGFDPRWGKELGLVRERDGGGEYDLFRRRLLFPICDVQGRVVAFGGRVLDGSLPKYINSPESRLYHKGRLLYGLHGARESMRRSGEGIVVEGYFDHLALARAGFENAVATCGTALTADHARLLKRYCGRLLLLFDQDAAGRKATFRGMEAMLAEGLHPAVVDLDPGEDPDSFLAKGGAEEFRRRLQDARPALEVFMEAEFAARGESIEGRAKAAEEVAARIALLPSEIERDLYLKALAVRAGVDPGVLRRKVGRTPEPPRPQAPHRPSAERPGGCPPRRSSALSRQPAGAAVKAQQLLLRLMLQEPEVRRRVEGEGIEALFLDGEHGAVARQILRFAAEGHPLDGALLCDPLTEEQKGIVSGLLMHEEESLAEVREPLFEDCRRAVEKERLRETVRELDRLLREAEAAGDRDRCAALQAERIKINRKLKS